MTQFDRLHPRFGTGVAAGALSAVYVVGFAALFLTPTLAVVITLQIVQRWMNFAIANPGVRCFSP
jgi:AAA family ATP:ADP antiporter